MDSIQSPFVSGSNNRIDGSRDYVLMIRDNLRIWPEHRHHQMSDNVPYHSVLLDLTGVSQAARYLKINHLMTLISDHNDDNDNESPILPLLFTHPI